jgi:hypothetical protein
MNQIYSERYKVQLKKSEFIFQKEYEAASELAVLIRDLVPKMRYPDMDWEDVCTDIASDFHNIENKMRDYLRKHSAILDEDVKDILDRAEGITSEEKFYGEEYDLKSSADKFYKLLKEAESKLINKVKSQVAV